MSPFLAVPLTCWLCVLVAIPRAPRRDDEVQQLAYRRLVGRHHLLRICAIVMTAAVAFALTLHMVTGGAP
jgi:hypothetical protein